MPGANPFPLPLVEPRGGAPVSSDRARLAGPLLTTEAPDDGFDAERPDNPVLRIRAVEDVEVLQARLRLEGAAHETDLIDSVPAVNQQALVDLGAQRPVNAVSFSKAASGNTGLMIQLGGTWQRPASAGGVNFSNLTSGAGFPELITGKLLLSNVSQVSAVTSRSFPENVTLRLGDGGVPFFFLRGQLHPSGAEVPDFGEQVALALRDCEAIEGHCSLDVVAHSDAFGTITTRSPRFAFRATDNPLAGLAWPDRSVILPAQGRGSLTLSVPAELSVPDGFPTLHALALELRTLALGPGFTPLAGRRAATVSEELQVARLFHAPGQDFALAAARLPLRHRATAGTLLLELRADLEGLPSGEVLGRVELSARELPQSEFAWATFAFEEPPSLAPDQALWLRLHAREGAVEWRGVADGGAEQRTSFSRDGGNGWSDHAMSAAFLLEAAVGPERLGLDAGGQTQVVTLAEGAGALELDQSAPLLTGLNAELGAAGTGGAVPDEMALTFGNPSELPLQVTLTRFDVTYTQTG